MAVVSVAQLFEPIALPTSAQTLFTSSAVLSGGIVRFANTTNGVLTVTAYAVPKGGTAGAGNAFMTAESLAANSHVDVPIPLLSNGDQLVAFASAAGVTAFAVGGVLYTP